VQSAVVMVFIPILRIAVKTVLNYQHAVVCVGLQVCFRLAFKPDQALIISSVPK